MLFGWPITTKLMRNRFFSISHFMCTTCHVVAGMVEASKTIFSPQNSHWMTTGNMVLLLALFECWPTGSPSLIPYMMGQGSRTKSKPSKRSHHSLSFYYCTESPVTWWQKWDIATSNLIPRTWICFGGNGRKIPSMWAFHFVFALMNLPIVLRGSFSKFWWLLCHSWSLHQGNYHHKCPPRKRR